ncbi:MAG: DoxX family protein [Pseudomonadota bacterium]
MDLIVKAAAPSGRFLLSLIFITAGFQKITGYAGTAGYMESLGVPGVLLPLVILLELGGGLMLLAGYQARIVAFLLGGFSVISGVLFHLIPAQGMEGFEQQLQMIMFMKNLAIAGGMGMIVHHGAGAFALDNRG